MLEGKCMEKWFLFFCTYWVYDADTSEKMVELLCIVVVCKYLVHWVIAGSVAKSVHSYVFSEQNKTKKKSKTKSTSLWTQIWEDQFLVGFDRIHRGALFYFPCEPNQGKIIFFISFFFLKFSIHPFTPTKYSVRVFES